jgi:hypothetical protein
MPGFTAKPTPPVNHQGLGGSPASPNAATGLETPRTGIWIAGGNWRVERIEINPEVAELERLLTLDKPKRVE